MTRTTCHTLAVRGILVATALTLGLALLPAASAVSPHRPHQHTEPSHPNVVVLLVDDATVADVASMPNVQALIADQGATFARNYSPEPLCCPARATILTGRYPHNHRVLDNVAPLGGYTVFDDSSTLATWLDGDYRTGLFGKYMNDNATQGAYVPPGWDTFKLPTRADTYQGVDPEMYVNGTLTQLTGESTEIYSRQARTFMGQAVAAGQPFFAYVAIVAPHASGPHDDYVNDAGSSPWVPARYRDTEARYLPDDPSVNEADVSDKPQWVRDQAPLTQAELDLIAERNAQKREALHAVDDEIALTIGRLSDLGVLDDTYIVFASDNGYMDGQHRIAKSKAVAYDPASRVPLFIRGPGVPAGATYDRVTGLQDVAPTVLDMTGEATIAPVDGVSLLDLLAGAVTDRPQLVEVPVVGGIPDAAVQHGTRPSGRLLPVQWFARGIVASSGWKYVEYPQTGEAELYNLDVDPFELHSLAADPDYADRVAVMSARLHAWQGCDAAACR
jgi:N-acetylglucosamine-6-sulfatase